MSTIKIWMLPYELMASKQKASSKAASAISERPCFPKDNETVDRFPCRHDAQSPENKKIPMIAVTMGIFGFLDSPGV